MDCPSCKVALYNTLTKYGNRAIYACPRCTYTTVRASRGRPKVETVNALLQTEHDHQARLFRECSDTLPAYPELALLMAIPNAGKRSINEGKRMKDEGLKAGVPDLLLPVARDGFFGLWIEMKMPGEEPRAEQVEWHVALRAQGYRVEVCTRWQDAYNLLITYLRGKRTLTRMAA